MAVELVEDMLSWMISITLNENFTFNEKEYLAANPNLTAAGINPYEHFLKSGVKEVSPRGQLNFKTNLRIKNFLFLIYVKNVKN